MVAGPREHTDGVTSPPAIGPSLTWFSRRGPGPSWLQWAPALVILGAAVLIMLNLRTDPPLDLRVYSEGARALLEGDRVYAQVYTESQLTFTYPPFGILVMLPLVFMGTWGAAVVVELGSLICAAVLVHAALGRVRLGWWAATLLLAAVMVAEPMWLTMHFGQVNLLLAGLITADLLLGPERKWRGVGLGIAAGIKLTPLALVAYLLLARQWRTAAVAMGTFLATIGTSFLLIPRVASEFWFNTLPASAGGEPNAMSSWIAHSMPKEYVGNQSIMGFFSRVFGPDTTPATISWLLVGSVVALAAVAVGAWLTRRGERPLGLFVASLSVVLASPIAWTHHWVWAVPLVVALVESAHRVAPVLRCRPESFYLLASGMAVILVADIHWWAPGREQRELDWNPMQMLVGNSYLIAGLAVVGTLAVQIWRVERQAGGPMWVGTRRPRRATPRPRS